MTAAAAAAVAVAVDALLYSILAWHHGVLCPSEAGRSTLDAVYRAPY